MNGGPTRTRIRCAMLRHAETPKGSRGVPKRRETVHSRPVTRHRGSACFAVGRSSLAKMGFADGQGPTTKDVFAASASCSHLIDQCSLNFFISAASQYQLT